jgi:hypothetical protein
LIGLTDGRFLTVAWWFLLKLVPDLSDVSFSLLSEVLDLVNWQVSKIF